MAKEGGEHFGVVSLLPPVLLRMAMLFFKKLFIYFWLRWRFVAVPKLQSPGTIVVVRGLGCPKACGILLDWGPNLCPLHWQADS